MHELNRRALLGAIGSVTAACDAAPAPTRATLDPGADTPTRLPAAVGQGARFLVDASGEPLWLHGDTAWSLVAQLSREDAETYLDDRRARGFNATLVSLLEHRFATHAPANTYGAAPFVTPGDFATPNEAYFAHADWVLEAAERRGLIVLLTPAYIGLIGAAEGWYEEMVHNGREKMFAYGRFIAERLGHHANIIWVHGGDDRPPNRAVVRSIAEGIRSVLPHSLHTAHCDRGTGALDYWANEPWLNLDTVYTGRPASNVYRAVWRAQRRDQPLPFFLLEASYENEGETDERDLRYQAYYCLLGGATGHVFGNNPVWHFDGPGVFEAPIDWRTALNSRGAQCMTHLRNLIATVAWSQLVPDFENAFVSESEDRRFPNSAALLNDRAMALAYLPTGRGSVDLRRLRDGALRMRWFDPSSGEYVEAGSPDRARLQVRAPGRNASGFDDWLLCVTSEA